MKLPLGFSNGHKWKVFRLHKSLYSLKQAPRCWFAKKTGALKQCGFFQSYYNYSMYTNHSGYIFLCVFVYENNLIVANLERLGVLCYLILSLIVVL